MAALGLRCYVRAFSGCGEWGLLFVAVRGLLIAVASLVAEHGLQAHRPQQLWRTGLVAPQHVGSSWTSARTRVSCIGRRILKHCTTREAPLFLFLPSVFKKCSFKNITLIIPTLKASFHSQNNIQILYLHCSERFYVVWLLAAFLASYYIIFPLTHSTSVALAFLLHLEHSKYATLPLLLQFPLPSLLFPQISTPSFP